MQNDKPITRRGLLSILKYSSINFNLWGKKGFLIEQGVPGSNVALVEKQLPVLHGLRFPPIGYLLLLQSILSHFILQFLFRVSHTTHTHYPHCKAIFMSPQQSATPFIIHPLTFWPLQPECVLLTEEDSDKQTNKEQTEERSMWSKIYQMKPIQKNLS